MTQQLEHDLRELFTDAASRVQIQPQPVPSRSPRRRFLVPALAAGLAAALVAGGVVAAQSLGGSDRSLPPADQLLSPDAQRLIDALDRTWSGPVRVESATTTGDAVSDSTSINRFVLEIDVEADVAEQHGDDGSEIRAVDDRLFIGIRDADRTYGGFPIEAQWFEAPAYSASLTSVLVPNGLLTADLLREQLAAHRATVVAEEADVFQVTSDQTVGGWGDSSDYVQTSHLRLHVAKDGMVDRVTMRWEFGPESTVDTTTETELTRMTAPVSVEVPDPATVLSYEDWLRYVTPAEGSSEVSCAPMPSDEMPRRYADYEPAPTCTSFSGSISLTESARSGPRKPSGRR
jgi:hypothetical protein